MKKMFVFLVVLSICSIAIAKRKIHYYNKKSTVTVTSTQLGDLMCDYCGTVIPKNKKYKRCDWYQKNYDLHKSSVCWIPFIKFKKDFSIWTLKNKE